MIKQKTKTAKVKVASVKTPFKKRFLQIFSRHPSINPLRRNILIEEKVVYRHGSTTPSEIKKEINSVDSVSVSCNKNLMKKAFSTAGVKTAEWSLFTDPTELIKWAKNYDFKIVAKSFFGSRGEGNFKISNEKELDTFIKNHNVSRYVFEKFYNFNREYRLHVDSEGCFYTCRKMLKEDTPKDKRWYRNDSNSVWIVEENEAFDKPVNWEEIIQECVKALKATGLDVGACDVKVQSTKNEKNQKRKKPDFIVIEINSAPSMGERTLQEYKKRLPLIINKKYK
jgi:D-alanine-D-alanine ligase-like ATP-grasp enzyme